MVFLSRSTITAFLLSTLLFSFSIQAQQIDTIPEQVYLERNEKGEEVIYRLTRTTNELILRTQLPGGGLEEQSFELGPDGETKAWKYLDSSRGSRLEAVLEKNRKIRLSGTHRGKPVDKTFKINDQPWNQPFQQGLGPFLLSPKTKTVFWAIGTRGKGELKITRFTVKKEKSTPIPPLLSQFASKGPFTHIKISLSGLLSMFWSGHYWYDAQNQTFLLYQGASSYLDGDVSLIRKNMPL